MRPVRGAVEPRLSIMPINIYCADDSRERVAWLCDDNWRLRDQAEVLEAWLIEKGGTLKPGRYIADIGFRPREDAMGGGAAISPKMMQAMADLGITLWLSEYPSIKKSRQRA
jgi:hypothetical protein